MKLAQLLLAASLATSTLAGCNRNKQDAVLLANEAEKARKGDKDTAIAKLEEAVRLDPDNHGIWFKLATIHEEKEDWPKMAARGHHRRREGQRGRYLGELLRESRARPGDAGAKEGDQVRRGQSPVRKVHRGR
jgi:tetratricopeptide (TPR) repeat protein